MKIYFPFINSIYTAFQTSVQKNLNSPQKKIMAVILVAFGALTTLYGVYRCFKAKANLAKQEKLQKAKEISSLLSITPIVITSNPLKKQPTLLPNQNAQNLPDITKVTTEKTVEEKQKDEEKQEDLLKNKEGEDVPFIEPETSKDPSLPVQNAQTLPEIEEKQEELIEESKESILEKFKDFTLEAVFEVADKISQFSESKLLSKKPLTLLQNFHSWQIKVGRTVNLEDKDTTFLRYRNDIFLLNAMFESWDKLIVHLKRSDLKNIQATVDYARDKIFPKALELFTETEHPELRKQTLRLRMYLDRLAYPRWQALNSPEIELEEDYAYEINIGLRTLYSNHWLGGIVEYNAKKNQLEVDNKEYGIVSGQVTNFLKQPLAYCGSCNSREIIILDPQNSPRLNLCYETFKQLIIAESKTNGQKLSLDKILPILMSFIRDDVYETYYSGQLEKYVEDIFDEEVATGTQVITRLDGSRIPLISLETYIEQKKGVCRHLALTGAYLLDRLQNDHEVFLDKNKGVVRLVRHNLMDANNITWGAHAWVNFISDNGELWHFDPMWNISKEFGNKTNRDNLCRKYGLGIDDAEQKAREIRLKRAKS